MGSKNLKAVLLRRGRRVPNENPAAKTAVTRLINS